MLTAIFEKIKIKLKVIKKLKKIIITRGVAESSP
jgi:hypothetical protein